MAAFPWVNGIHLRGHAAKRQSLRLCFPSKTGRQILSDYQMRVQHMIELDKFQGSRKVFRASAA
jgi:hypothetical protein